MSTHQYIHNINLKQNALINATLDPVSSDPGTPVAGQVWYNSTENRLKYYDGSNTIVINGADTTDTLTNKTFDANGTGNVLANVEVADFASSALSSNLSTSALASQLATADAVKAYADAIVASGFKFKGVIDASTNPDYPAAVVGDVLKISVAGKIGGASGLVVQVGDAIYCTTDSASGDHATVGGNFAILQGNVDAATDVVLGLMELATSAEANGKTGNQALTPANTQNIIRYGKKAAQTGTTGTVNVPTDAVVVTCYVEDRGERVEIGWSLNLAGTILTWDTGDSGYSIDGDIILGYVYDFATLT